jgi:5'(3')-deoxyribonucleotidase
VTDTFLWIGENKVPTREVHFTEDKWKIDCDLYLDDAPGQLENYLKNKPNKVTVRFIRPYNKPLKGVTDITSWKEFYSLINSMS